MKPLLIDGLNITRRVFEAAQRNSETPIKQEDFVKSSLSSLLRAVREVAPTHVICVFDGDGPTWRHDYYPDYKANREPPPAVFVDGCIEIRDRLAQEGIKSIKFDGFECDDVIASLAHKLGEKKVATVILSTDKDFSQLLSEHVWQYNHFSEEYRTPEWVVKKFDVEPALFTQAQAFMGDETDNIPGVKGIGPKTAAKLLKRFGSLDKIIRNATYLEGKMGVNIRNNLDNLKISFTLVTLKTDINLGLNLKEFSYPG